MTPESRQTFKRWRTIGSVPTVANAVGDALRQLGVKHVDIPATPERIWTLIRGAGVRGAPRTDATCPNCGAPLVTNMAGECDHCGAKLTRGDFDWVLSKIEQDDSYTG